ncbi:MAG: Fic family protein [Gammaproteobacteria bacterium]
MLNSNDLLNDFKDASTGLTLRELLSLHPSLAQRTAQRWISQLINDGQLISAGKGRARRYYLTTAAAKKDIFPMSIPLSPDSRDILTYIEKPITERKPVGYQIDFIQSYMPNQTFYLPLPVRIQLRKMGEIGPNSLTAGTYERAILARLLIDLSWASSHLEGNTYSLLDTKNLIEQGKIAHGKAAIETQMILNHKSAIELLINNRETTNFNRYTILNLHSALSENLLANPADEGRLRQQTVEITKSVFHPLAIPQQIEEMFDMVLSKASEIQDPFEQAFFAMVHIPYLQPFIDINKRTSRLAANISLIRHNLCPLTFLGITEQAYTRAILGVYELTRVELLRDLFVWAYERSTQEYIAIKQNLTEPDPLRLKYREIIKQIVHNVVIHPEVDTLTIIQNDVKKHIEKADIENVQALIIDELRRLHEGILARYQLRISEFHRWQEKQKSFHSPNET